MAQIANIVLADGQTTPANHTFEPYISQKADKPAIWYNKEATSPLGYRRVTLYVDFKQSGISKVRIVISDPVLASLPSGCCVDQNTPQVSYTDFFDGTFSLPAGSTIQNRKDILAFAKNLLNQSVMTDAVVNLTPAF